MTVVASVRRIEWEEAPPNFLVVFPLGALEGAPLAASFAEIVEMIEVAEESGLYYDASCRRKRMSPVAADPALARRLWEKSVLWCGLEDEDL